MNARTEPSALALPIRLTSPYAKTIEVTCYGVPMEVSFEHDPGESPIVTGGPDNWHPGTPPNAALLSCRIGGVEVLDMLTAAQVARVEETILEALE